MVRVVGGHEDRQAVFVREASDPVEDEDLVLEVQGGSGFVQDEDVAFRDYGAREDYQLALSADNSWKGRAARSATPK